MRRLFFLVLALHLAGCGAKPDLTAPGPVVVQRVEVRKTVIPDGKLTCLPEPDPLPDTATQADQTHYTLDALEAGRDCRANLATVRRIARGAP